MHLTKASASSLDETLNALRSRIVTKVGFSEDLRDMWASLQPAALNRKDPIFG